MGSLKARSALGTLALLGAACATLADFDSADLDERRGEGALSGASNRSDIIHRMRGLESSLPS